MEPLEFLKIAAPIAAAPIGGIWLFKHHFSDHNNAMRLLYFKDFDECMLEVEKIQLATELKIEGDWTLYQNLVHCAQSIEYSMTGYPQNKPKLFQNTLGALIFKQFENQGYMRHNRNKPIPGANMIDPNGNNDEAIGRLKKAIVDFDNLNRELKPHFAYGRLNKTRYAEAHCMHLADHFAMITY